MNTANNMEKVNHPKHYNHGKFEVIDVIEDWDLGFHLGNAIKYIARAGKKTESKTEDLKKAIWYLKRTIEFECVERMNNIGKTKTGPDGNTWTIGG